MACNPYRRAMKDAGPVLNQTNRSCSWHLGKCLLALAWVLLADPASGQVDTVQVRDLPVTLVSLAGASGTAAAPKQGTGLSVAATPSLTAANGTRYKGSLDPAPGADPLVQGKYEQLPQDSGVVAVHLAHVPNSNVYLYMERPSDPRIKKRREIAGTFDLVSRKWTPVESPDGLFCSCQTQTADGSIMIAGGHRESGGYPSGMQSVRLFNIKNDSTHLIKTTTMQWKRWYPSLTLLPNGQLTIMGGTPTVGGSGTGITQVEVFTPSKDTQYPLPNWNLDSGWAKQAKKLFYPFNFVLPTGDLFTFCERQSRVVVGQTGEYRKVGGKVVAGPRLTGDDFSQFPFSATAVFTPLTYRDNYSSTTFILFGGAPVENVVDNTHLAGRSIRSMKISWSRKDAKSAWSYSFGDWVTEDMGIPRVMGDATLLPNADVLLNNGAQEGVAGDASDNRGNGGRSDYPAFWAQLYQPDRPLNQRLSTLAGSKIARMYHSVSVLTTNGTVLVTGCDRCYKLQSDVPGYVSPNSRWEYRQEIFYPPYWFDTAHKPRITQYNNGGKTLAYNQVFSISWAAAEAGNPLPPITSVMLVAPSAVTHNQNFNQRLVELPILSYSSGKLTVRSPPHPYIAPPQWYMIFINNGKTYSQGVWVQLVDTRKEGQVVPK